MSEEPKETPAPAAPQPEQQPQPAEPTEPTGPPANPSWVVTGGGGIADPADVPPDNPSNVETRDTPDSDTVTR